MVLEISNEHDFFKIKGELTRKSLPLFKETFRNIFDKLDSVILSIEGLKGIDRYGVNAIAQLHNEALNSKKKLSIIGLGHKEVFHHFSENDAA